MIKYKQNYCDFFDLFEGDIIYSEINGEVAVDLHHIYEKGMGGREFFTHNGMEYHIDCVENLIAVTRDQHDRAHAAEWSKDELWEIHQHTMNKFKS